MHENEVSMRLKFEIKLNNLSSMYREIETRLCVMFKDFQLNIDYMKNMFESLDKFKKENNSLTFKMTELNTQTV